MSGCDVAERLVDDPALPNAGADDIVWQVTYGPGFTATEIALGWRPSITVYGDGRYLVTHLDENGYSPSEVKTFEQGRLTSVELTSLRAEVAASGAFDHGEVDYGTPQVMDAGTVTLRALGPDGASVELSAYALGAGGDEGLTERQNDLRSRLDALVDDLEDQLPDQGEAAYKAERLTVYALDTVYVGDDTSTPHRWPGPAHTKLFAAQQGSPSCATIEGSDVAPVLEAAQRNPDLGWRDDDGTFFAVVTVALPGDASCDR